MKQKEVFNFYEHANRKLTDVNLFDRPPAVYIENTKWRELYATQLRFRLFLSATVPSLTSIPSVNSQKDITFRLLL